ncbi:hypothetical protein D3C81_581100 [compost metagenome]
MSIIDLVEVGSLVKLKAGGPTMAVQTVHLRYQTSDRSGDLTCQWFAGKKLEKGQFPAASLELVEPEPQA